MSRRRTRSLVVAAALATVPVLLTAPPAPWADPAAALAAGAVAEQPAEATATATATVTATVTATTRTTPAPGAVPGTISATTPEPATDPAADPTTDPATEPATHPATDPTTDLATDPATADAPAPSAAGRQQLQDQLNAALGGSTARLLGAAVDVEGYGPVLRAAADAPLLPASTQKSYVALSALLALGPDARYRTEVAATAGPVLGRVRGHLWLVAGGDPYLTSASLRELARSVRQAGVRSVTGDVRLDDLRYDQRRNAAGWRASFVPRQSGPLSALAVDGNRWRSDGTFLADPAFPAAVLFRDHLRAEGVHVRGEVRRGPRPARARTVAVHRGTTVAAAVERTLKTSDNFAAELLLKEVGRVVRGDGSSPGGLAAVRDVLAQHGVPVGAGSDGSGLSADDRQTPAGQLQLLQAAQRSPAGPAFRASLPLGCRNGTLLTRFCGTAAEGRVWAKTGSLSGVRALAGVTRTASGRDVQFAFQLTGVADGARALAAIDRAVVVLAGSTA